MSSSAASAAMAAAGTSEQMYNAGYIPPSIFPVSAETNLNILNQDSFGQGLLEVPVRNSNPAEGRIPFYARSLYGISGASQYNPRTYAERHIGELMTRGQMWDPKFTAESLQSGVDSRWDTAVQFPWWNCTYFPVVYDTLSDNVASKQIIPWCVMYTNVKLTNTSRYGSQRNTDGYGKDGSNGDVMCFEQPLWTPLTTRQPLPGNVFIDGRYLGNMDAWAAVIASCENCGVANDTYLYFFPCVSDNDFDAKTKSMNASSPDLAWRFGGPSLGLAVAAAIMGMPQIMYTGYLKAMIPNRLLDNTPNYLRGTNAPPAALKEVGATLNIVESVDMLTLKCAYAINQQWPLIIPYVSSLEYPLEKLLSDRFGASNKFLYHISRAIYTSALMNDAIPYAGFQTTLLMAGNLMDTAALSVMALVFFFGDPDLFGIPKNTLSTQLEFDDRARHSMEQTGYYGDAVLQYERLLKYRKSKSAEATRQREYNKATMSPEAYRALVKGVAEQKATKMKDKSIAKIDATALRKEQRAMGELPKPAFGSIGRKEQAMAVEPILNKVAQDARTLITTAARVRGQARWDSYSPKHQAYAKQRLVLSNPRLYNAKPGSKGAETYSKWLDTFKRDFPVDDVYDEDRKTYLGPGATAPSATDGNPFYVAGKQIKTRKRVGFAKRFAPDTAQLPATTPLARAQQYQLPPVLYPSMRSKNTAARVFIDEGSSSMAGPGRQVPQSVSPPRSASTSAAPTFESDADVDVPLGASGGTFKRARTTARAAGAMKQIRRAREDTDSEVEDAPKKKMAKVENTESKEMEFDNKQ